MISNIILKSLTTTLKYIRIFARENKEFMFNEDIEDFINFCYLLPANNYGTRIQNRIINKLGLIKTARKNEADCIHEVADIYIEIKTSIIDDDKLNNKLNIANIMEWQPYTYYIVVFDMRDNKFEKYFFVLTQFDMKEEIYILNNVRNTHNQNLDKEHHSNLSKKFEIKIDSNDWKRWCELYKCKTFEDML